MADRKISDLTALTTPASGDFLPIVDISEAAAASKNKRITIEELMRGVPDGTAAAPGIAFETDPNTGIFSPGADQLAISTGGTARLTSSTTALTSALPVDVPLGAAATPSLKFTGDLNTGIYSPGADQVSIATNGTERLRVDSAGQIKAVSLGTAAAPTFSFTGDPNTGIYSPGADRLAVATNGVGRLFINSTGLVGINNSNPQYQLDLNQAGTTSLFGAGINAQLDGADHALKLTTWGNTGGRTGSIRFITGNTTGGAERLRITSAGLVGIGTSAPTGQLTVLGAGQATTSFNTGSSLGGSIFARDSGASADNGGAIVFGASQGNFAAIKGLIKNGSSNTAGDIAILTRTAQTDSTLSSKLYITAAGNVGIGTTSPSQLLHVQGSDIGIFVKNTNSSGASKILFGNDLANEAQIFYNGSTKGTFGGNGALTIYHGGNKPILFATANTERIRIDGSGRLLIRTSTSRAVAGQVQPIQNEGTTATGVSCIRNSNDAISGFLLFGKSRGATTGTSTAVIANDALGGIVFAGADGTDINTQAAGIYAEVDGTPGPNDMPGRLVFSTTADGAASPTERMRITQAGNVLFGKTTTANGVAGINLYAGTTATGVGEFTSSGDLQLVLNRLINDGTLVDFRQDGTSEGTISVSGTTVSYNGAHLSRWSQLPSGAEREEILRGSVLSNIDEMCEWTDEENEQLNRMKVSDVEGDKNVSGVFQCWDDDDDTYTDDFYCAMTGDFIIRIAEGVTVERGDLLMSAGDGTAKPQDDDIIRSKTIAKVTSTNVSCTYADGSYCVPCVLMAC
jgi:hypothetical protein